MQGVEVKYSLCVCCVCVYFNPTPTPLIPLVKDVVYQN